MSTLHRLKSQLALLFASKEARRHGRAGNPRSWKTEREFQISFLKRMGLESGQRLLELSCGTLCGGLPVIEFLEPGNYTGVEGRADVLEEARAELSESGLAHKAPRLVLAQDLGTLDLPGDFDWVCAFGLLSRWDDAELERALALVAAQLAPQGSFCANVSCQESDDAQRSQPIRSARNLDFYRAALSRHGFSVRDLGSLASLGHTSGDPLQDGQHMLLMRSVR